jgi:hypothetical protein
MEIKEIESCLLYFKLLYYLKLLGLFEALYLIL